ncbi:hypothetical protein PsYK624_158590 [Phanerochaete sordida]|uniref:DUF6533 domain-containing protein n=1 Tax=Phanerochaete sordida TaxID=48140 RepID=A0A9P3GR31_9APHY|nr:hypothetical protein PsYK624_158590 [Phanerochaete sordida]
MAQPGAEYQELLYVGMTTSYVGYSMLCLGVYEYIITFCDEAHLVWGRRFNLTTALLLACRLTMIMGTLINALPATYSPQWCKASRLLSVSVELLGNILIASVSALRVCALWRGARLGPVFSLVVFILATLPVGTNIFGALRNKEALTTISSAIAADVLVLLFTWIPSFRQWWDMRKVGQTSSVTALLLRDGTFYFASLLAVNILYMLTFTSKTFRGQLIANLFQFLPIILVQRFMLNLRQLTHPSAHAASDAQHFSRFSGDVRFPSELLGNLGEPLDHSQSENVTHEDDETEGPADAGKV